MSGSPSVHLRVFATWLAVYPLITVVLALARPVVSDAPLPVQTLVLTAVVVPTAVYVAVPTLLKFLTGGARSASTGATEAAPSQKECS
jgi:antibiotic biosynthesis monooxygenase (ABM) superfamily enzyme